MNEDEIRGYSFIFHFIADQSNSLVTFTNSFGTYMLTLFFLNSSFVSVKIKNLSSNPRIRPIIRSTVDWNGIFYFLNKLPFPGSYICIAFVCMCACSPSSTPIVHLSSKNHWEFQFVISKINYKIIRTLAKLIPRRIIN